MNEERIKRIEQINEMMLIQDELNSQLSPEWKKEGWNFKLAANVEMVEGIEHYGWKWWKHQEPDINQVKMEMADIWHFLLSETVRYGVGARQIATEFNCISRVKKLTRNDFLFSAEEFISLNYLIGKLYYFFRCMRCIDMSFEDLRNLYLGKAILNKFRWNNGYNDGTYVKVWDGLEDNEYLTSILMYHPDAPADEIYQMLEEHYRKIV